MEQPGRVGDEVQVRTLQLIERGENTGEQSLAVEVTGVVGPATIRLTQHTQSEGIECDPATVGDAMMASLDPSFLDVAPRYVHDDPDGGDAGTHDIGVDGYREYLDGQLQVLLWETDDAGGA